MKRSPYTYWLAPAQREKRRVVFRYVKRRRAVFRYVKRRRAVFRHAKNLNMRFYVCNWREFVTLSPPYWIHSAQSRGVNSDWIEMQDLRPSPFWQVDMSDIPLQNNLTPVWCTESAQLTRADEFFWGLMMTKQRSPCHYDTILHQYNVTKSS